VIFRISQRCIFLLKGKHYKIRFLRQFLFPLKSARNQRNIWVSPAKLQENVWVYHKCMRLARRRDGFKPYNAGVRNVNTLRFKNDLHSLGSGMRYSFIINAGIRNEKQWIAIHSSLNSPSEAKSSSRSPKYALIATGHKINLFRSIPCYTQCLIPPSRVTWYA